MKTAERETPNRRPQCVANRADGAASHYRSCSIMWAAKQENFQPAEKCFFLTSPFIELTGHLTYQDFTCPVSAFTRRWVLNRSFVVQNSDLSFLDAKIFANLQTIGFRCSSRVAAIASDCEAAGVTWSQPRRP